MFYEKNIAERREKKLPTLNPNIHYVKFIRGSVTAWETLNLTPQNIDDDTLYFIYESAQNTKEGKLYLGQKLISGTGGNSSGVININDIGDISIGNEVPLSDAQILVYNDTSQKWENASLSTIINTAIGSMRVFSGATENMPGLSGIVPAPPAGAQDKFLKGDGSWDFTPRHSFDNNVFDVLNNVVSLSGFSAAAANTIPVKSNDGGIRWTTMATGQLNRTITTLEKLQAQLAGTDPDPIDENTIYMVANSNDPSSNNAYDEYMIINNRLERLGTFGQVDLTNYVQVPTFNTAIGTLNDTLYDTTDENTGEIIPGLVSRVNTLETGFVQIGNLNTLVLSPGNTTLVDEVNTLGDRMKWHELNDN